jgi:hypothetical protein
MCVHVALLLASYLAYREPVYVHAWDCSTYKPVVSFFPLLFLHTVADPAPGRGGLEPPLPPLGPWSPS